MLQIEGIEKRFSPDSAPVLTGLSLSVPKGSFTCFLGPSGCGKTTLLRILAGLERPDAGFVRFEDKDVTALVPQARPFHMVFQKYALFPHLSVFENVVFGLRVQKVRDSRRLEAQFAKVMELVRLDPEVYRSRFPHQLSGGQGQRVAIARALVLEPKVLLLDEPLSALDLKLREEMRDELKRLQRRLGLTFIFVTHDQTEALALADQVVIMNEGSIAQEGSPESVYLKPKNEFVARFVGQINEMSAGPSDAWLAVDPSRAGAPLRVQNGQRCFVRPENIQIETSKPAGDHNSVEAVLELSLFRGDGVEWVAVDASERKWRLWIPKVNKEFEKMPTRGDRVFLTFSASETWVFNEEKC